MALFFFFLAFFCKKVVGWAVADSTKKIFKKAVVIFVIHIKKEKKNLDKPFASGLEKVRNIPLT